MSDKTTTETLRQSLDERGVEWEAFPDKQESEFTITATQWHDREGGLLTMYISEPHGSTWDFFWYPTPEQAVEATLGRGTCRDKGNIERFICSECGCRLDLQDEDWEPTMWLDGVAMVPRYCPNCGRKIQL